eukprot:9638656-Alexandrium_andersonii.AAC.1
MSASLVGSEMCIRDSCRRKPPAVARTPPRTARWRRSRSAPSPPPRWTVSYTHLTLPTICSV